MSRSRTYRTHAIILKRRQMGEADRLLTLFTPTQGKVDAIAKGARKPSARKSGHVELFTCVDVLIARGRNLDILTQAQVIAPYRALREDLTRGAYAGYVAELLDHFTLDATDDDSRTLYDLLNSTLARLCDDDDLRRVIRYYELRLLDAVGFRPELHRCVITQATITPVDQFFSYEDGGVVSPDAIPVSGGRVALPLMTLKVLRHLQRTPYEELATLHIPPTVHNDLERIMHGYLRHILERRLQSVDFIRRIRHLD